MPSGVLHLNTQRNSSDRPGLPRARFRRSRFQIRRVGGSLGCIRMREKRRARSSTALDARSRCEEPGPAFDPDRSATEAARRARGKVRRFVVANRLDRLGHADVSGDGLHDERALRRHVAHFFKAVRYELVGEPYPYLWVPEWHKTDHGLHVHYAVDRYIDRRRRWRSCGVEGSCISSASGVLRREARSRRLGVLRVTWRSTSGRHSRNMNGRPGCIATRCAQGFSPKVERIVATLARGRSSGVRSDGSLAITVVDVGRER